MAATEEMYGTRQWFELRDTVNRPGGSDFYRGAIALAFNQPASAEKIFAKLFGQTPDSREALEARRLLAVWFSFTGQHRRSLRQYALFHRSTPSTPGVERELQERKIWARYPNLEVRRRRASALRYTEKDGDLFLPVSINGSQARFLIDTGANTSVISESEARRIGMKIENAPGLQMHDAAGASSGYRIAVAKELAVGGNLLGNVSFLVVSDERMPFSQLPAGERGILGLPVLFALQTIRWDHKGTVEIGFQPGPFRLEAANLCFSGDGPHLVAKGELGGRPVYMVVDTGDMKSRFLPYFATSFEEYVRDRGQQGETLLQAMVGSRRAAAVILPETEVLVGGRVTKLRRAELISNHSPFGAARYHLWLGSDLLKQADEVSIDFRSMKFRLK
ncbi:MAG: hypothetical protein C0504_06055 [Candidatus Solibacter sp.]|nr:hypothetical protein [Candidatus Solibacter sp.]